MQNGSFSFPVDIFAVKEYGVDRWQKEFFWPVSDKEYAALCRDIEQCLRQQVKVQPQEISDLLIIKGELRNDYGHFLHALKVITKIKSEGRKILHSDKSLWYKDFVTDNFANSDSSIPKLKQSEYRRSPLNYRYLEKIETATKTFAKNFVYNSDYSKIFSSIGKEEIVNVCGSVSLLMRQYIKRLPHWVYFTSQGDWLAKSEYTIDIGLENAIKRASGDIVGELKLIAERNEILLSVVHINYLLKLTQNELLDAAKLVGLVRNKINKRKKKTHLLIQNLGNPLNRALCIPVRRGGGKITSFSHGGCIGLYDTPHFAFSEFALSDEFITYTPTSVELFEKIKNNHRPLRDNQLVIRSSGSFEYFNLWKKHGNKPLPSKINKIMFIGAPHSPWRNYKSTGAFSLMHLDLELRSLGILKKAGYDIFYKAHPDRIFEIEGVFDNKVKVLTKGYFQDYLDLADAYLFGGIRTTAFSIALCTNKPIIAFQVADELFKPFPEAIEKLKKRCSFIYTRFDERNRMIFDEKELLGALSQKPVQPNNEFIETYMFPCSIGKYKMLSEEN